MRSTLVLEPPYHTIHYHYLVVSLTEESAVFATFDSLHQRISRDRFQAKFDRALSAAWLPLTMLFMNIF